MSDDFEEIIKGMDEISALMAANLMLLRTSPNWMTAMIFVQDSRRVISEELSESVEVWRKEESDAR